MVRFWAIFLLRRLKDLIYNSVAELRSIKIKADELGNDGPFFVSYF